MSTLDFTDTTSTNVYASFDHALQNLPSELYVQKLLEITSNNEQLIKEYRYALLVKAKPIQGCPTGKLMTRKTTKSCPSSTRYARDCFALYLFCNGDSSHVSDVFDKSKPDHNNDNNEFPIQSVIELRSLTQALMQRVTELEKAQSSYVKTIESLKKSVNALKAENVTLSNTTNKL